jgi:hypothetical protein
LLSYGSALFHLVLLCRCCCVACRSVAAVTYLIFDASKESLTCDTHCLLANATRLVFVALKLHSLRAVSCLMMLSAQERERERERERETSFTIWLFLFIGNRVISTMYRLYAVFYIEIVHKMCLL